MITRQVDFDPGRELLLQRPRVRILEHLIAEAALDSMDTIGLEISAGEPPEGGRLKPGSVRLGKKRQATNPFLHRLIKIGSP
jgi:hypothetical protein